MRIYNLNTTRTKFERTGELLDKIWQFTPLNEALMNRDAAAQAYGDVVLWEQTVQFMAHDFVRLGDTVFDVGGNVGGLSVAFSRMVGLSGQVVSFECNPPMIEVFRKTIELNKINNVVLHQMAAYAQSGLTLSFSVDPSFYSAGSSLVTKLPGGHSIDVETVALDDITAAAPRLIKIDVEGAEFDVLKGARRIITEHQPIILLEYFYHTDETRDPLAYLSDLGYSFYDVNLYQPMLRADYSGLPAHSNVLALPAAVAAKVKYRRTEVVTPATAKPIIVGPGRWLIHLEVAGAPDQSTTMRVLNGAGNTIALGMAPLRMFKHHADACIVLMIEEPTELTIQFGPTEPNTGDARLISFRMYQVHIERS